MATLPLLKTGAVTQYPASTRIRCKSEVLRYLDGNEQRYREHPNPAHEWAIRLDLLDEGEVAAMEEFFQAQQGQFGSFAFTDPHTGIPYPDCSIREDSMGTDVLGEMRGRTMLVVKENRA
jgi:hypothetical protein